MARKIPVKLVMKYRDQGLSRNMIAKTQTVGKSSVSEAFKRADELHLNYEDIQALSDTKSIAVSFQNVINLKYFMIRQIMKSFIRNFKV